MIPVFLRLGQPGLEPGVVPVAGHDCVRVLILIQDAQRKHVGATLAWIKRDPTEPQSSHRFVSSQPLTGNKARLPGLYDCLRPVEAAARSDERLQLGEKGDRGCAVAIGTEHGIGHGIEPVPAFVKGEGGPDHDPVRVGGDPVQQRGHMAMVAHSVGRAAKDRDGGGGGQGQWL